MAWRRRSPPRDRGRASHAHDLGARSRRNQFRFRSLEPDVPGRRHRRLRGQRPNDRAAGHAMALFARPRKSWRGSARCRRRAGADTGAGVARIVQSARHAQRHAGVRRRRHAAGLDLHAGERAGLGQFGLLYLNDGVVGGKRILHEDWVDFCAAATLDTDYAAGFWTNRSEHPNARGRVRLAFPAIRSLPPATSASAS